MTEKLESKNKNQSPEKKLKPKPKKKVTNDTDEPVEFFSTRIKQFILIGLSISGFAIYLIDLIPDQQTHVISQMSFRVAIVLLTIWLAFPQLEKLFKSSSSVFLLGALLVAFVVTRIQLVLLAIVAFCLIYALAKYVIRFVKE